jgi:hypothetical protein
MTKNFGFVFIHSHGRLQADGTLPQLQYILIVKTRMFYGTFSQKAVL